jgi:hypothetical protein
MVPDLFSFLLGIFVMFLFYLKYLRCKKCAPFENRDLINHLFDQEAFSNKDEITVEDSYNNKMLFEQKVFNMLNSKNKKKYLNLTEAAKDMFLTKVSLTNI